MEHVQSSPDALQGKFDVHCWRMAPSIEKISAITFRVLNMQTSVQFYRNVLGMELLYGGEQASFSSLRANDSESAILNLEQGDTVTRWGRLIFHVTDVDAFWAQLKERGFNPEIPRDASWGNATSTCSIRMTTNCRLLSRCNELARRNVLRQSRIH
jgi:catechol 2,3-dioxygenase-like lactoylglutathione lyase family enzyme